MPIMVNCSCGNVMSVVDEFAGKTVVCNQCQRVATVPAVGPTAPATPAPGESAVNPYLAQNAGYAAAAAPQGYSQAPSPYYTRAQLGEKSPGRGLLITGGVLSILAFLSNGGWSAMFSVAAANGKLSTIPSALYGLLGLLALMGIVFASLSFASMSWAALASGIIQALFVVIFAVTIPDIADRNNEVKIMVGAATGFAALAALFTFLGVGQAKRFRAWKGG